MLRPVRDWFSYGIVLAAWVLAVARISRVRASPETGRMSDALAHQIYLEVTDHENEDRRSAALRFQGSLWSQQDEFHSRERAAIRGSAALHRTGISSIVNVLDRGMRERWPTHPNVVVSQKVIPCRPRLAY
jgi:hypothetical protein